MTSETCKLEIEKEVRCKPQQFYEMVKYSLHHLPTVFPEAYKSCEVIEGDGESVGSVRLWKYNIPGTTEVLVGKEKTEVIDDEKWIIVFDFIEGDHTDHYKCFKLSVHILPTGEGSLVKGSLEYQKQHDAASDPHHYVELFSMIIQKLEGHLVSNA